jgi:hypothetical protein
MNKSGFVFCFVLINILLYLLSSAGFAGQEKADVCHLTGTYQNEFSEIIEVGHVINIADPAYQSHIDHGDIATGQYELFTIEGIEMCKAMVLEPTCGIPGWSEIVEDIISNGNGLIYDFSTKDYYGEESCKDYPFYIQGGPPFWVKDSTVMVTNDYRNFLFCMKAYDDNVCTLQKNDSWMCAFQGFNDPRTFSEFHIDNKGITGTMSEVEYEKCRDIIHEIGLLYGYKFGF